MTPEEKKKPAVKQIADAIANWLNSGHRPPKFGVSAMQPVMQPIRYTPTPPALPDLPVNILPFKQVCKICGGSLQANHLWCPGNHSEEKQS